MTTALAGVGLGGIAIALGAQKTLENLFGGISILSDESLRVGDTCVIGTRVGTVEDISLRSVRIRTVERTELSIPSGTLATMSIENLSRRDKVLFNTTFGLRYETTVDQLRYVLAGVRRMLYEHPKVETVSARIRFAGFGASSLDTEIFCYVLTEDYSEFLAIREDLLLRVMEVVTAAGSAFALPARTIYQTSDPGVDKRRAEAAAGEVEKWRQRSDLPFPDFKPADISAFRGSIPYPRPDSSLGGKDGSQERGNPGG
jgi:MscS family membrane protein